MSIASAGLQEFAFHDFSPTACSVRQGFRDLLYQAARHGYYLPNTISGISQVILYNIW
jgi:hypothetical protein